MDIKNKTHAKLCENLLKRIIQRGGPRADIYKMASDEVLQKLSGIGRTTPLIDRQTLLSLSYFPHKKRDMACRKLSDALAMEIFSDDMGRTLDFASSKMTTNPHLPGKRQDMAIKKSMILKNQTEMALAFERNRTPPLNQVLSLINEEGNKYKNALIGEKMRIDRNVRSSESLDNLFFDCADDAIGDCHHKRP